MRDGLFEKDAAIRELAAEPFPILGGGTALLLQLAHPKVALGVAEHSGFQASPFPRLLSTLDYLGMVVFGTRDDAHRVAWSAMRRHDAVRGDGYSAHDPELLLWVQATLFQISKQLHERFLGPLEPEKAEEYYQQMAQLAVLLGAPREALPDDAAAFDAYWTTMVTTLEVSDAAREQARAVLFPAVFRWLAWPAMVVFRLTTTGLLPDPIRRQYGLAWTPRRERLFLLLMTVIGFIMRLVPGPIRRLPVRLSLPLVRRFRWRRYRRPPRRTPT